MTDRKRVIELCECASTVAAACNGETHFLGLDTYILVAELAMASVSQCRLAH